MKKIKKNSTQKQRKRAAEMAEFTFMLKEDATHKKEDAEVGDVILDPLPHLSFQEVVQC